ncbi:hypothetical protein PVL29_015870 [Vitis rotundifolia]|uniref:Uncharacterized protein n=1 Tax=Vitis rotundifolia TaxID=103349 RepID=A0AA39DKE1_VITRO|nr:hypothetical protein PVL29_015870 [Vitis rotundifolia]
MAFKIPLRELLSFHSVDRQIFSRLILNCLRKPSETLLVMAMWLWLEEIGYPNIVAKILILPDSIVNAIANEAVLCLKCLSSDSPPPRLPSGNLPLSTRAMEMEISLQMFFQNKFTAISGIKKFLNSVCAWAFTDILVQVLPSASQVLLNQPVAVPGFPHPLFGNVTIVLRSLDYSFPIGGLHGWNPTTEAPVDDRTMFLTFSRGNKVSESDVRELFTGLFGDCVDSVNMEEVSRNRQPLFARLVLRSVSTVDRILNGSSIAKFAINSKHIWARKYERRE